MKPSLVILAAGMGSRYGGLKQIDGIGPNEETISDYGLFDAIEAGFGKVVFIIRESFKDDFSRIFGPKLEGKVEVHYVSQELADLPDGFSLPEAREKPWGTSHAVWAARNVVNEPFAVINADDYYGREAYAVMADFLMNQAKDGLYSCMGYKIENTLSDHGTVNRGYCEAKDGFLVKTRETLKIKRNEAGKIAYPKGEDEFGFIEEGSLVSMNFWGFAPEIFDQIDKGFVKFLKEFAEVPKSEYFIPLTIQNLIDSGTVKVKMLESDANWFGVTYKEDKPLAQDKITKLIEKGVYPADLWEAKEV